MLWLCGVNAFTTFSRATTTAKPIHGADEGGEPQGFGLRCADDGTFVGIAAHDERPFAQVLGCRELVGPFFGEVLPHLANAREIVLVAPGAALLDLFQPVDLPDHEHVVRAIAERGEGDHRVPVPMERVSVLSFSDLPAQAQIKGAATKGALPPGPE